MQYSKSDLQERATEVVDYIRDNLLDDDGILFMGILPDGSKNLTRIIDDFGDVAPFIALYGGEDICLTHLEYLDSHYNQLEFDRSFAYTDLIFGLIWYSRIGIHKELAKKLAVRLSELVTEEWFGGGKVRSTKKYGLILPVTNGLDTTYIEVWTEMYRLTNNQEWLDLANEFFKYFYKLQGSNKHNLVPTNSFLAEYKNLNQLKNKFNFSARVLKDNANYGYGLLDLYRLTKNEQTKEAFNALFSSIDTEIQNGRLPNVIDGKQNGGLELLPSFAFLDMVCDAHQLFGDEKYLASARLLADKWLAIQSQTTGLFPKELGLDYSYFDSETDMGVALLKLYAVTSEEKYLTSAEKALGGLLKYHQKQNFPLEVSIEDGAIINAGIKTKFVALYIKFLHVYLSTNEIYQNDTIFFLAKDR